MFVHLFYLSAHICYQPQQYCTLTRKEKGRERGRNSKEYRNTLGLNSNISLAFDMETDVCERSFSSLPGTKLIWD